MEIKVQPCNRESNFRNPECRDAKVTISRSLEVHGERFFGEEGSGRD